MSANDSFNISEHGMIRCQQRGIPREILPFIIKHGKRVTTHNDNKSFISNKSIKKLQRDHQKVISKFDKHLRSTAVIWRDKTIITAYKINGRNLWK